MIFKGLSIIFAVIACVALWFGYMNLNVFRGTPFFDFRYVLFAVGAFLGLSALEWLLGWIKAKFQGSDVEL